MKLQGAYGLVGAYSREIFHETAQHLMETTEIVESSVDPVNDNHWMFIFKLMSFWSHPPF